jgi:hypothetical protein
MTQIVPNPLSLAMTAVGIVTALSSFAFTTSPENTKTDRSTPTSSSRLLQVSHQRYAQIPPPRPDDVPPPPPVRRDWDRDYRDGRPRREAVEYCLRRNNRDDRLDCLEDERDDRSRRPRYERRAWEYYEFPPYRR